MGRKKYLKQIKSFKELIENHLQRLENERNKSNPGLQLIQYWEKEIQTFRDELVKSEKRLKRARK